MQIVIAFEETVLIKSNKIIKNSIQHYDLCMEMYGNRSYLQQHPFDIKDMNIPPLLLSLPGSGNSWSRLLIEYSSGYYTGSIYGDPTLFDLFPGEKYCGRRMSAIKAHPGSLVHSLKEKSIWVTDKAAGLICNKGLIKKFYRVLLLVRNPWNSIYSEFIRRQSTTKTIGVKFHNTTLKKDIFNTNHWIRQALMQVLGIIK